MLVSLVGPGRDVSPQQWHVSPRNSSHPEKLIPQGGAGKALNTGERSWVMENEDGSLSGEPSIIKYICFKANKGAEPDRVPPACPSSQVRSRAWSPVGFGREP